MYHVRVIDWGDDAYKKHGSSVCVFELDTKEIPSVCYDGGRIELTGYEDTIWVDSHQFSIEISLKE